MKKLLTRAALTLCAIVACSTPPVEDTPIARACANHIPSSPFGNTTELPSSVDYTSIKWDRSYYLAFTTDGCTDLDIHLSGLRFEFDCPSVDGEPKVKVNRSLSSDEISALSIDTTYALVAYLKERAKSYEGYAGPGNKLF